MGRVTQRRGCVGNNDQVVQSIIDVEWEVVF